MTEQFKRDMGRYIVIKRSDLQDSPVMALRALDMGLQHVNSKRALRGKSPLECVVVESDWPEYEYVWAMIEARVTGESVAVTIGERAHQYAESIMSSVREEFRSLGEAVATGDINEALKLIRQMNHTLGFTKENEVETLDHLSLDTGKVDQVVVHGAGIIDRYPGREDRVIYSAPFTPGEKVEWCESGRWYPGTVKAVSGDMVIITDQHGNDGEYRFGITPIVAQLRSSGPTTEEELNDCLGFPLPDWAVDVSDGTLKPGLQLCTKDGRRSGNAHIIGFERVPGPGSQFFEVFTLLTDAGNRIRATEPEIDELFYRGEFISDPQEVITRFGGKDETE